MSRGFASVGIHIAGCAMLLSAQSAPRAESLELIMERSQGDQWKAVNPQTVLDNGNSIRFRLKSSFSGYLYVYYRGSGGEAGWLYPSDISSVNNRIESGVPRLIPSGSTSYGVAGKPGFDTVYWLVSPRPLAAPDLHPPADEGPRDRRRWFPGVATTTKSQP